MNIELDELKAQAAESIAAQKANQARLYAKMGPTPETAAVPVTRLAKAPRSEQAGFARVLTIASRRRGLRDGHKTSVTVDGVKRAFKWNARRGRWQELAS